MIYITSVDANTFRMHGDDLTVKPDLYPKEYEASAIKVPNETEPRVVIKHKGLGNEIVTIRDIRNLSIDGVVYATAELAVAAFNTMVKGVDATDTLTNGSQTTTLSLSTGEVVEPNGNPSRESVEVTRPANTTNYSANDAIGVYAAAVKQKDTVTLSGTSGTVNISIPNIANRDLEFDVDLTTTAAAFVTDYAADFLPLVVVTSSGADIIFEAATVGVPFSHPVVVNTVTNLTGDVVNTTANVTLSAVEFENMAIANGGGGFLVGVKIESNIVAMAATTIRLWLYNEAPALVSGDNAAFLTSYADRDKLIFFVDVEMQTLETGSDSVVGYVTLAEGYKCADTSLFGRLETKTVFTPTSGGKINVSLSAIKIR